MTNTPSKETGRENASNSPAIKAEGRYEENASGKSSFIEKNAKSNPTTNAVQAARIAHSKPHPTRKTRIKIKAS